MKSLLRALPLALVLVALLAAPAVAQSGFGLKAHLVYNWSQVDDAEGSELAETAQDFVGFNVGAEYVLPLGIGVGLTGYTSGDPRDTDAGTVFILLGEANYFMSLPLLPVTPYAGVHFGLGTFAWDSRDDAAVDTDNIERANMGWQLGARVQLMRSVSLDAQYRRLSASAEGTQDPGFESDQLLVGVRIF